MDSPLASQAPSLPPVTSPLAPIAIDARPPAYAHGRTGTTAPPVEMPHADTLLTAATLTPILYDAGLRASRPQVASVLARLTPYMRVVTLVGYSRDAWLLEYLVPGITAPRVTALDRYGRAMGYDVPRREGDASQPQAPAHSDPLAQ